MLSRHVLDRSESVPVWRVKKRVIMFCLIGLTLYLHENNGGPLRGVRHQTFKTESLVFREMYLCQEFLNM